MTTALLLLGAVGCAGSAAVVQPTPSTPSRIPSWLPPYGAAQLALIEPGPERPEVPALPTYPDLSRFRYGRDHVLEDPKSAMRATKVVNDLVSASPRVYTLSDTPAELANDVAQYGPASVAPDEWVVARRDDRGRLVLRAVGDDDARAVVRRAQASVAAGRAKEAVAALEAAIAGAPDVPALELARARAAEAALDPARAEQAYREALRIDPTLASAHLGLARGLFERGDLGGARISLAHALAYHPTLTDALALAIRLDLREPSGDARRGQPSPRVRPFAIFLEVDAHGVVRVGGPPTTAGRMYAGCRAILRYEPELRGALFDSAPDEPYFLSVPEEMFCLESALGAYLAERSVARDEGRRGPDDEQTGHILALAHTEGLLGFIMFEILGKHRPERARTAPSFVHAAAMRYVQRHVLGYEPSSESELLVAQATPVEAAR